MADFAPELQQTQAVPYIMYSREIQEPRPDVSGEILGKGLAQGLNVGVEGVDAAIKKGIQNDIYSQVDPLRDKFMQNLHVADEALRGGQGKNGDTTVSPTGRQLLPSEVKQLPKDLDMLSNARANGKLSQTDYDARLNVMAKQIRAQYPGYREYVDESFQRATGRNSANQYISQVLGDINSFEQNQKAGKDKVTTELFSANQAGIPGAAQMIQLHEAGKLSDAKALEWVNQQRGVEYNLHLHNLQMENLDKAKKLGEGDAKDYAKGVALDAGSTVINGHFDTFFAAGGISDSDKMQGFLNDIRNGKRPNMTPEQANQMGLFMNQNRGAIAAHLAIQLGQTYNNGRSVGQDLGGADEMQKEVENIMKLYYDPIADAVTKGDWSLANSTKKMIEGKIDDKGGAAFSDAEFNNGLAITAALHKYDPPMAQYTADRMATLPDKIAARYGVDLTKVTTPPEQGGQPTKEVLQNAAAKNISGKPGAQYYKTMIDTIGQIANHKITDQTRDALIENTFSDQNKGLIGMFAPDSVARGQKIPGRETVFNTLTSQGMSDAVYKRSIGPDKTGVQHPEYWSNYKDWAENDVRYVFNRDALAVEGTNIERYARVPIAYDMTSNSFKLPPGTKAVELNDQVKKLNGNLRSMANIYKTEGSNPDAGIYKILTSVDAEPGSVVDRMKQAIIAAHGPAPADQVE
jgi:hypothetical protein